MVSSTMNPGPTSQNVLGRRTFHKDGGSYSCSMITYSDRRGNYRVRVSNITLFLFPVALRPNAGQGLLILEVSRSHTTHYSR
jgi:hypothetical protein